MGGSAYVYRLTDLGHEVGDELSELSEQKPTVAELEDRIEQQQEEIQELQQRYDAVVDYIEDLEAQM